MGLRDFTLFDVVERNARLYPDRLAFAFDGERITHAGYLARVQRLAAGLGPSRRPARRPPLPSFRRTTSNLSISMAPPRASAPLSCRSIGA